ncbi:hypothetical protein O3G_MSEX014334 [Manduca sexta]|uniref:Uncharacterized protein n=2 Tax=Manduca sexta TaxID=7130 RepID=A0A921ZTH3_MANSE|nr:hypothetical protein O3G_MSEX014334 [Manduca sexta]
MLFVCVVLVMFLEGTHEHFSSMDDIPLTKSLGYSLDKNFGKTLRDSRLSQEYIEQYQEMLKVSQESIESISNEHTKFRREGDGNFELGIKRRRSAFRLRSPAVRRRARSQAARREKLNSQSLLSHRQHSRQINRYED